MSSSNKYSVLYWRITQLGLASYVFPGATHTRFSHCLGAAYLAHSALTHLKDCAEDDDVRGEIDGVFNEVIVAALLHDVGHGPFSHSFEQVLKEYKWAPNHEDWTASLITSDSSEINKELVKGDIDVEKVASVFKKSEETMLARPFRQIVSSQIDVDRMDYLLRDSHFAGVAIGQFDVQYLLNSMVIVDHGTGDPPKSLGLTPKGVTAYEAFLLARQLMNRTVYFHHNTKVLEFMVESILRLLVKEFPKFDKDRTVSPMIPSYFRKVYKVIQGRDMDKVEFMQYCIDDYVKLTDDVVWVLISAIAESPAVPLAQDLASRLLIAVVDRIRYERAEPTKV